MLVKDQNKGFEQKQPISTIKPTMKSLETKRFNEEVRKNDKIVFK